METNNQQHIKAVQLDSRSRKRLRFLPPKQRAKLATADVYRSFNRRSVGIAATTSATREREVHGGSAQKLDIEAQLDLSGSTLAQELDLARERNSSQLFSRFFHELSPLVHSLPEILHHLPNIISILLRFLISPVSDLTSPSSPHTFTTTLQQTRTAFAPNLVTTDVLHLLAVLARDVQNDIHSYLYPSILTRIVYDLIYPPVINAQVTLNIATVESAFRTLAYMFRYDSTVPIPMDTLRQFYGCTLGHTLNPVRRLAAETFAPLLRKLSDSQRIQHFKKVVQALCISSKNTKLPTNAIHGVAMLLFYTAKGVEGTLHSKVSEGILQFVLEYLACQQQDLCFSVAKEFMYQIMCHLKSSQAFLSVWKILESSIQHTLGCMKDDSTLALVGLDNQLHLLCMCVQFNEGALIQEASSMYPILENILNVHIYKAVPKNTRKNILDIVASVWKNFPQDLDLAKHICGLFPWKEHSLHEIENALFLTEELLPSLDQELAMKYLVPNLLSSMVSGNSSLDDTPIWKLLFTLVCCLCETSEEVMKPIFCSSSARSCTITLDNKEKLIQTCLGDSLESLERLGCYARILPFLVQITTHYQEDSTKRDEVLLSSVLSWFGRHIQSIWNDIQTSSSDEQLEEKMVVTGLILGGLSSITSSRIDPNQISSASSSPIWKKLHRAIEKSIPMAYGLLLKNPSSSFTLLHVMEFVQVLSTMSLTLSPSSDEAFEALIGNLHSPNPYERKFSLAILNAFPKKPYVTDFAALDIQGDLDDEHDFTRSLSENYSNARSNHGLCDLLETLVHIESLLPSLENERNFLTAISRVEVLGLSGRLPIIYSEAAIHHMFGILHVKFQPIWPAAIKAIVALITAQEKVVWPCVEWILEDTMKPDGRFLEESQGKVLSLHEILKLPSMQYTHTDKETIIDLVWSVTHKIPIVISRKATFVVPLFIYFLAGQYYVYNNDDPDAREIDWHHHINIDSSNFRWDKSQLTSKTVHKKLVSFLSMFSGLKGLKHLYKSDLLLFIFTSFLSHPDVGAAKLSLECVARYNLPYVNPYIDTLRLLLGIGQLRETLTKINASTSDRDFIEKSHRQQFFPLIIRLLFGRLLARGSRSNSTRPADARRSAIMSFVAMIANNNDDGDFSYFVYLMIRAFVPKSVNMTLADVGHANKERIHYLINCCMDVDDDTVSNIPISRLEGFLNLLSTIIKQCALSIEDSIIAFFPLCLKIIQFTEVHRIPTSVGICDRDESQKIVPLNDFTRTKISLLRNSGFRRLQELLDRFMATPIIERVQDNLWSTLKPAISTLPGMVINAVKPPSILKLLETITIHQVLVKSLHSHDDIIQYVILCISNTSTSAIMECIMQLLENLLSECGIISIEETLNINCIDPTGGISLLQKQMPLLLDRFTLRLGHSNMNDPNRMNKKDYTLVRKELNILRRLGELLSHQTGCDDNNIDTLGILCKLLVPHIQMESRISEDMQSDILNIMMNFVPRIKSPTVTFLFVSLSKLLGPNQAHQGITDKARRFSIARVIDAMSLRDDSCPVLRIISRSLIELSAISKRNVDEYDFDRVLPIINQLGNTSGPCCWSEYSDMGTLLDSTTIIDGLSGILPLMYTCLHLLYDSDGVIARGCLHSIKMLISFLSQDPNNCERIKFAERTLIPCIRSGLKTENQGARKSFIHLIYEVSKNFSKQPSPFFHGDLNIIMHENEPDLDFFQNLLHVQVHRRNRAVVRLRKILVAEDNEPLPFSILTLMSIFLPLLMHPIYESSSKEDENYAIEAITTIGTVARMLPIGKYQRFLWSSLLSFNRHPDKERFLVTLVCSIIDAFHFKIDQSLWEQDSQIQVEGLSSCLPSDLAFLKCKIIPKIEGLLVKKKASGSNSSSGLRYQLVLSLMKLFEKISDQMLESKFSHLIGLLCDALRSRESDERDHARLVLAKVAAGFDKKFIPMILRELTVALKEGYQLHVRAACLHSILMLLAEDCRNSSMIVETRCHVDNSLPAMMDIILSDLFGVANDMKEVEGVKRRLIKEAMGNKSYNSLQIMSELIQFQPSRTLKLAIMENRQMSSVHILVKPFLDKLRDPESRKKTIGKAQECLSCIVTGLSKNDSVTLDELLPFVKITIASLLSEIKSDDSDKTSSSIVDNVFTWNPSSLRTARSTVDAHEIKRTEHVQQRKVVDGHNAPRLSGSSRNDLIKISATSISNPATVAAIIFCLDLTHVIMKKIDLCGYETMIDPLAELIVKCISSTGDKNIIIASLKNINVFLRLKLSSMPSMFKKLGCHVFDLLIGSSMTMNHASSEIIQVALKTLAMLITKHDTDNLDDWDTDAQKLPSGKETLDNMLSLPLSKDQMHVLISFLHRSVQEADQYQHGAILLIRAITSRKYLSPEYYDLIEGILRLSVQSQTLSIRQNCCRIFMRYLIEYPMGQQRLEQHLKQMVLNLKYSFEDGRLSSLELLTGALLKLPLPLVDQHSQLFFLPLVLQLSNDDSKLCREAIAKCLGVLLKRLSILVLQDLYGYCAQWMTDDRLCRAATQVVGLFVENRPDFFQKGTVIVNIVASLRELLLNDVKDGLKSWEKCYFSLQTLEKINTNLGMVPQDINLWFVVLKCLVHPHPWIQEVSSRMISAQLKTIDSHKLSDNDNHHSLSFFVKLPGTLFELARNLCHQIGTFQENQSDEVYRLAVKNLTWVIVAMHHNPRICFKDESKNQNECLSFTSELADSEGLSRKRDPVNWLITRLSFIAQNASPSSKCRQVVFQCFGSFAVACESSVLVPILEKILGSLLSSSDAESELAKEVLQLLESKLETPLYLETYMNVQNRLRTKRQERKETIRREAVVNPQNAAKRKIAKHQRERCRQKRRYK